MGCVVNSLHPVSQFNVYDTIDACPWQSGRGGLVIIGCSAILSQQAIPTLYEQTVLCIMLLLEVL